MPQKKSPKPPSLPPVDPVLTVKTSSKIRIGDISKISGEVNIASGNIIKNIRTIHERALTTTEEEDMARSLEGKLLAEGVSSYIQQLQLHAKNERKTGTPYKGLLEYRLAEAESFHGRKQAIESLLETMGRGSLTILHSESGAGKTSLLQAGIMPRILAHGYLPLYLRPYDKSPSLAIKQTFLPSLSQSPHLAQTPLHDFLSKIVKILGKKSSLFILIDQFEEFFIRVDDKEQAAFINELGECLDDKALNVHWLISLRSEYFGRLANFRPRIHNPYENDFLLKRLTREEAREAITNPVKKYKITFEPGLTDKILDDLGKDQIVPPQLQLVCSALYETLPSGENLFTKEIYEVREGGTNGILRGHLERVLKRLPPEGRVTARQVLEALITSVQQRALRPRTELIQSLLARGIDLSELQSIIEQLVESRLLRVDESDDGPAYELAHDYLLNEIILDPEIKKRKQAEELLEQGIKNWNTPTKILLSEDMLAVIESQRGKIKIEGTTAELLFWSAIKHNKKTKTFASHLTKEQRQKIIQDIRSHKLNSLRRIDQERALWIVRKNLSFREAAKIGFKQTFRWIWTNAQLLILIAIIIFILGITLQYLEGETSIVEWRKLDSFETQCLKGKQSINPMAAINIAEPSEIIVYDPQTMSLCQSKDEGQKWVENSDGLPEGLLLTSISFNKNASLTANKKIFIKKMGEDWQEKFLPEQYQGQEPSVITQPINNPSHIYLGLKSGLILFSPDLGNTWEQFDSIPISELRTLSSNGIYLIAGTPTKIFFRTVSDGQWKLFNPKLEMPLRLQTAVMITPIIDSILVLTEDGIILDGFLENDTGLQNINSDQYPSEVRTIAAFQSHEVIGNPQGLYYRYSWTFFNLEWWKLKIQAINLILLP